MLPYKHYQRNVMHTKMSSTLTIRMDDELKATIDALTKATGLRATQLVRWGLNSIAKQIAREGGITIKTNP